MDEQLMMISIFIILMGYFSQLKNNKMFFVAWIGLESGFIIDLLFNKAQVATNIDSVVGSTISQWFIVIFYFGFLFVFGMLIGKLDEVK